MDAFDKILINKSRHGDFAGRRPAEVDSYYTYFGGNSDRTQRFGRGGVRLKNGAVHFADIIKGFAMAKRPVFLP